MPVAKPTKLPRWADAGGAIVEPTSGKKDIGFVQKEKPPAPFVNWLFNLIYLWTAYLDDLANQAWTWAAAHTFNAVVTFNALVTTKEEATLLVPQVKTTNNGSIWRGGFDHIGFPSARPVLQFHENWMDQWTKAATGQPRTGGPWVVRSAQLGTGSVISGVNASATWGMPYLQLQAGNANADAVALMTGLDDSTGALFHPGTTKTEFAIEWLAALTTFVANTTSYFMGFCPANATDPMSLWPGGTPSGCFFRKLDGETKWKCVTGAGAGAQASGAVGPAAGDNELHRFRIEWHGSAVSGYAAATVRYFIDDALVATHASTGGNWPTLAQRFGIGALRTAGAATNYLVAGPVNLLHSPLDI